MKRYVTRIYNSEHYIYKLGFGTYDLSKSGLSDEEIHILLDDYISMGGNVIDTSIVDIGNRGNCVEESQKKVGGYIRKTSRRGIICLISKSNLLNIDKPNISHDLEISLKNLNTNYLDVFLVNGDNEDIKVSQIIDELDALKKNNKIRKYGCSNWKPHRIREAMEYSKKNGIEGFTVNQMLWNIGTEHMNPFKDDCAYVKMDKAMMDIHKEFNIMAMPYTSLCDGFFAKLYLNETEPGSVDINSLKEESPYYTKANIEIYKKIKEISSRYIASPGGVSLGYLFNQEINTCPIFSTSTISHMKEAFEAVEKGYSYEDFKDILKVDKVDLEHMYV